MPSCMLSDVTVVYLVPPLYDQIFINLYYIAHGIHRSQITRVGSTRPKMKNVSKRCGRTVQPTLTLTICDVFR